MKINSAVIILALCLVSANSFANREEFNRPSNELETAISTAATGLGYDLSSKDGRKSFGDYLKTQKDALATSLGIDTSTEEGKKKMHEAVKSHVDSIAKEQGFDMSTQAGRDSLEKYLISKGEYAYLKPDKKGPPEKRDQAAQSTDQSKDKKSQSADRSKEDRPAKSADAATGAGAASGSEQKPPPRH